MTDFKDVFRVTSKLEQQVESVLLQDSRPFQSYEFEWEDPELTGGTGDVTDPVIIVEKKTGNRYLVEYHVHVQRLPALEDDPDYVDPNAPEVAEVAAPDPNQMELFE